MIIPRKNEKYGWKPDLPDHRDRSFNAERVVRYESAMPPAYTLSKLPPIFNQLQLGSCTANAIVGGLCTDQLKEGEGFKMLSRLFVYWCEREIEGTTGTDAGAMIRDGIKSVSAVGAPLETTWPYDISRFAEKPDQAAWQQASSYKALEYLSVNPRGPGSPLRSAIYDGYVVIFGFSVPALFEGQWNPATEYLPLPSLSEEFIGGHAVGAVGWDFSRKRFPVPVLKIRNSWGEGWGENGYFWMDARWLWNEQLSNDFWIVEKVR